MEETVEGKVMSTISAESFIGRGDELRTVEDHARNGDCALIVSAKPGAGSTELLRQVYDRLFLEQGEIIPFLFEFKPSDRTVRAAAIRFLHSFFVQFTAFRRNDPQLCAITPDVCELSDLSAPSDSEWVNRLIETCTRESELNNESTFIRNAVSAPMRAEAEGNSVFCLIGGLEHTQGLVGDTDIFEQLKESFEFLGRAYLFSGKRRFIERAVKRGTTRLGDHRLLELDGLGLEESGALCTVLGDSHGVETTAQTRDLIGLLSGGSPFLINAIFHSAAGNRTALDSFKNVQQTYVKELMGGRIRTHFDSCFELISPDSGVQRKLVDLIYGSREFATNPATSESWNKTLKLESVDFRRVLEMLNCFEFVNSTSNLLSARKEMDAFSDYLDSRFRLEVERAARPAVYGEMLTRALKRAPQLMAQFYRRSSSIGLREILSAFNCQETPVSLLFYNVFKERYKGRPAEEIVVDLANEAEKVTLPQIVYSVNTVSLYGRLSKFTDEERSAVALGFEAGDYTDENETVWIAAEIDSKLEAEADLTEFWCDRLEMVALMGDYRHFRIWLIAPEGFSDDAVEVLRERNAIGSSRKQVELLAENLGAQDAIGKIEPDNTFELVVPMGDDTELIAAHAVEEIARRHSFNAKSINQIKTALVEACINATEHSKSPDRKIYQRFEVDKDKITVTISNRGLQFKGKKTQEISPTEGRRGWGLKLMRSLMDDVRFEQVDDGTRISMTKLLKTV